MITQTHIANMALSHVGARGTIESLNEQSVEAMSCRLWYDLARVTTLEAQDWTFARKKVELALDGDDAPLDWTYRYQYPGDCIKARSIVTPTAMNYVDETYYFSGWRYSPDTPPFEIELNSWGVKTVVTDTPEAVLRYTADISDTTLFSRNFIFAMSYGLASMIAVKLTGKVAIKQECEEMFLKSVRNAAAIDANEGIDRAPREATWITARN